MSAPSPTEMSPTGRMPERVYRLLLHAYPAAFRAAYGREMTLIFRDQWRDAGAGARFWADVLWDVLRSAPATRLDAHRARRTKHILPEEATMRPMSIFALFVGAIQMVNALIEARAGWVTQGGATWLSSLAAVMLASILLASAGIALQRRTPASGWFVRASAAASLALFAGGWFLHPWMSVFARLLGFGFPIVLILSMSSVQGRGPTAPAAS